MIFGQVHLPSQTGSPNSNVGINQSNPTARLHISDDPTKTNCTAGILINANMGTGAPAGPTPEAEDPIESTCSTPYAFRVLTNTTQSTNRIMANISPNGNASFGDLQDINTAPTFFDVETSIGAYYGSNNNFARLGFIGGSSHSQLSWNSATNDPFHISFGQTNNPERLVTILPEGQVGIGTENPETALHIVNTEESPNDEDLGVQGLLIENNGFQDHDYALEIRTGKGPDQGFENGLNNRVFTVSNSGTVHIGYNLNWETPYYPDGGFKLYVQDGIRTERVKVDIASQNGWADYVFDEDYEMMSIQELEAYIQEHKHLPGVPSAEEVVENGVDLGEMNKILLEKIEELTLRMMKQEKRIKELEKE